MLLLSILLLLSHRLEEMLELKEALQKQLDEARDKLAAAEVQLADSRKQGEALAAKLKTAEEAKTEAEQVRRGKGRSQQPCSCAGITRRMHKQFMKGSGTVLVG